MEGSNLRGCARLFRIVAADDFSAGFYIIPKTNEFCTLAVWELLYINIWYKLLLYFAFYQKIKVESLSIHRDKRKKIFLANHSIIEEVIINCELLIV